MGIDIQNNFKPKYIIPEDKEKVVKELKKVAKDSDEVWLATDEDREGEAISWHLRRGIWASTRKPPNALFFTKLPNLPSKEPYGSPACLI